MRNKYIAAIIAFFFGYLGAHKFYLGKHGQGILYLIFFCISWIPALIDMVILLAMSDDDFDAKYNLSTEGLLLHKERMELEREKLKIQKLRLQRLQQSSFRNWDMTRQQFAQSLKQQMLTQN